MRAGARSSPELPARSSLKQARQRLRRLIGQSRACIAQQAEIAAATGRLSLTDAQHHAPHGWDEV
eukprot:5863685-Prymnesium_polylepis.2